MPSLKRVWIGPGVFFWFPPFFSLPWICKNLFFSWATIPSHTLSLRLSFSLTPTPNHLVSCVSQSEPPTHLPTLFPAHLSPGSGSLGFGSGFCSRFRFTSHVGLRSFHFILFSLIRPSVGRPVCLSICRYRSNQTQTWPLLIPPRRLIWRVLLAFIHI